MRSMTGFGTAVNKVGKGRLSIEVRTINHRYCDIVVKLPPKLGALEVSIREFVRNKIFRGRVEIFIKELQNVCGDSGFQINLELAKRYIKTVQKLRRDLKLPQLNDPLEKAEYTSFIQQKEESYSPFSLWPDVQKLLGAVFESVDRMRSREGRYLQIDQKKHIKKLKIILRKICQVSKNNEKTRSVKVDSNDLSKQDITEELTRLASHIQQYEKLLCAKEAVGRKLDFFIQEMNRELNTIGSKACDAFVSQLVVEAKTDLERLREQAQNLE